MFIIVSTVCGCAPLRRRGETRAASGTEKRAFHALTRKSTLLRILLRWFVSCIDIINSLQANPNIVVSIVTRLPGR